MQLARQLSQADAHDAEAEAEGDAKKVSGRDRISCGWINWRRIAPSRSFFWDSWQRIAFGRSLLVSRACTSRAAGV
eukprot:5370548-Karenia_brevis.AAC.1